MNLTNYLELNLLDWIDLVRHLSSQNPTNLANLGLPIVSIEGELPSC